MSDNNKYDTMPFSFNSTSPLPTQSDGLKVGLRDYFAGQALAGQLSNPDLCGGELEYIAKWSYRYADAMIAERQKERE